MRVLRPLLITSCLVAAGCGGSGREAKSEACTVGDAIAVLEPTKDQKVHGMVHFHQEPNGVRLTVKVDGLAANSTHAFHIHEFGDLGSADGSAAGGHFNPGGHQHGGPDSAVHHAGDLGNLVADAKGSVAVDRLVPGLAVCKGANAVLGRSVVLHDKADDFTTQPSGNAGSRIAVGVIGVTKSTDAAPPAAAKPAPAKAEPAPAAKAAPAEKPKATAQPAPAKP